MNHSKFQVLSKWTHSNNFVLDPPGLDVQNQFMMTSYPLYGFLNLNKLKQSEFQALSIGPTHRSKLWSGLSTKQWIIGNGETPCHLSLFCLFPLEAKHLTIQHLFLVLYCKFERVSEKHHLLFSCNLL